MPPAGTGPTVWAAVRGAIEGIFVIIVIASTMAVSCVGPILIELCVGIIDEAVLIGRATVKNFHLVAFCFLLVKSAGLSREPLYW
jgi:hypothetical protein